MPSICWSNEIFNHCKGFRAVEKGHFWLIVWFLYLNILIALFPLRFSKLIFLFMLYKIIRKQLRCYQHLKIVFKGPGPWSLLLCGTISHRSSVNWARRLGGKNKISPRTLITTGPKNLPWALVCIGSSVTNRPSWHLQIWEGSTTGIGSQAVILACTGLLRPGRCLYCHRWPCGSACPSSPQLELVSFSTF